MSRKTSFTNAERETFYTRLLEFLTGREYFWSDDLRAHFGLSDSNTTNNPTNLLINKAMRVLLSLNAIQVSKPNGGRQSRQYIIARKITETDFQ